jgi:Putative peptidoglycan binding domain
MRKSKLLRLIGIISIALAHPGWAAGHGGGGGEFSGGGIGGGGGGARGGSGVASRGGGVGFGRPASGGRPAYYYSRGMHYSNARTGQVPSSVRQAPLTARPDARRTNSAAARPAQTSGRPAFNRVMGHIAERHNQNWHQDWDRRHAHFSHNRFFVFIDGFWCGLDAGFFPWDYYPYYAYDYYPYDYYPGYYADVEPYYYNENVYSNTPMVDPTVTAVEKQLTQLGYYNGPVDGIYGPLVRDAVAKYQIAMQLDVNGNLSAQTLQSLGLPQPAAS